MTDLYWKSAIYYQCRIPSKYIGEISDTDTTVHTIAIPTVSWVPMEPAPVREFQCAECKQRFKLKKHGLSALPWKKSWKKFGVLTCSQQCHSLLSRDTALLMGDP